MRVFLYKLVDDELIPSDDGDIYVLVDNIVKIVDKDGKEVNSAKFKLLGDEIVFLQKLREIEKITGIQVDERIALAYPDLKTRKLKLNQLIGEVFEEYVYSVLSNHFKIERNKEIGISLPKLGIKKHNKPDFIIEGRIAIEAKTGDYSLSQILEYEKKFPKGAIVFPWSGECKTRKWLCFYNFLKDHERVIKWIRSLLD